MLHPVPDTSDGKKICFFLAFIRKGVYIIGEL